MYLRWQSRKRGRPESGPCGDIIKDRRGRKVYDNRGSWHRLRGDTGTQDVHWAAIVVESVRINGKPTQRHVAYLAGITESRMAGVHVHPRRYFWDDVLDGLDRLGNRMSISDRKRIEAAIALKVPRLTPDEHEASVKQCIEGVGEEFAKPRPYRPPLD